MQKIVLVLLTTVILSCGDDPIPKPKAFLRLEYPDASYIRVDTDLPLTFEKNSLARDKVTIKKNGDNESFGIDIEYPSLKGTIYLTYKKVKNANLTTYLRDAQNFTQKHTQKADEITEQVYSNSERNVYGMFYEVGGNAASQSQFYVTDSVNHFLTGSLYFYAKPNYDSILPAADYLKRDIQQIMESLEWKQ